jgi:hypothetical protein
MAMSTYYKPEQVKKYGRKLWPYDRASYRRVAVSTNGVWDRACDVTEQSEYDYFYEQYMQGLWLSWDLYDYDPKHEEGEGDE